MRLLNINERQWLGGSYKLISNFCSLILTGFCIMKYDNNYIDTRIQRRYNFEKRKLFHHELSLFDDTIGVFTQIKIQKISYYFLLTVFTQNSSFVKCSCSFELFLCWVRFKKRIKTYIHPEVYKNMFVSF